MSALSHTKHSISVYKQNEKDMAIISNIIGESHAKLKFPDKIKPFPQGKKCFMYYKFCLKD